MILVVARAEIWTPTELLTFSIEKMHLLSKRNVTSLYTTVVRFGIT
jgi:hypothetical protein